MSLKLPTETRWSLRMDKLEQMLTQLMTTTKLDNDQLIEGQYREGLAREQQLAAAEVLLRRMLEFVIQQRERFSHYRQREQVTAQKVAELPARRQPATNSNQ